MSNDPLLFDKGNGPVCLVYFSFPLDNVLLIFIPLVPFCPSHTQLAAVSQYTMPAFLSLLQLSYFHPPLKRIPFI